MFAVIIKSRNYSRWLIEERLIVDANSNINTYFPLDFHPINYRLFHGDFFNLSTSANMNIELNIKNSVIKEADYIPGVLLLTKTFGSAIKKKMYYKCIPNDPNYPAFLIAYEIPMKYFHKTSANLYILFKFKEWVTTTAPIGVIDRIIGAVDVVENLYDYEIFCKGLENVTMRHFAKEVKNMLQSRIVLKEENKEIEDEKYIFSIDPPDCRDYDDAFSITQNKENDTIRLCVYISNVPLILDNLSSVILDQIKQVSTIYLPHKKNTMMPTILSDDLCSLRAGSYRETLVMEIVISKKEIKDILFYTRKVFIHQNYNYEEPALITNKNYQLLERTVSNILLSQLEYITEVNDSHDLVAYLMIFMNHQIGTRLKYGIFRVTEELVRETDPPPIYTQWRSQYIGKYIILEKGLNSGNETAHKSLRLDSYVHITSPIRRIVDIINMIIFQQQMGLANFSLSAIQFVDHWTSNFQIALINAQMRKIRRIQNVCSMIHQLKDIRTIEGIIVGKEDYDDELNNYNHYNEIHIYFPSLQTIFFTSFNKKNELELHKTYCFYIHMFDDEDKMKRRIRLSIAT